MHPLDVPTLETPRLRIRRLVPSDLDAVHALRESHEHGPAEAEPERRTIAGRWLAWSVESYERYLELDQPPYGERAIVRADDGALVGLVGIVPSFDDFSCLPSFGGTSSGLRSAEVGLYWMVHAREQRKGIATEAAAELVQFLFESLRVHRVIATTEHDNAASLAVMRKLDMRIERNPDRSAAHPQAVGILDAPPPSIRRR